MKKIVLFTLTVFCYHTIVFSQDTISLFKKNEFKINIAYLLNKYPEFTYERNINEDRSFGISLGFSLGNNFINEYDNENEVAYNFNLIPFYKVFFGEKPAAGFYIEFNTPLYSEKNLDGSFFHRDTEGGIGFGVGFAIGGKFVTKSGWVGEIYIGSGRSLINNENIRDLYFRSGITIGKRF